MECENSQRTQSTLLRKWNAGQVAWQRGRSKVCTTRLLRFRGEEVILNF